MNEQNNFALVPKPPSAVEKVAPGAKRVLSGMVADTLALAKREPPKRRGTLLIVDDEENVRLAMQMVFKDEYDLFMAEYGVTAIKVVQENDIDVVTTNIRMPGMSGIDLLERLKFEQPDIEVIMATAFATTETLLDALRFGASDYISKPFEIAAIRAAVRKAMQRRRLKSETTAAREEAGSNMAKYRELQTRPLRIVHVNDEAGVLASFDTVIRNWFPEATVLVFSSAADALIELLHTEPDLLITDDGMPGMRGSELCQGLLDRKVTYPIIVDSAWEPTENWVRELASRGLNVFFLSLPYSLESLRKVLEAAGLKISREATDPIKITSHPQKTRPPRIVVVDDENWFVEMVGLSVRSWFKDVTLLLFVNKAEAWRDLSATNPDLLILGMVPLGDEILPLLAERNVRYPILATSGYYLEADVRGMADPKLKLSFLAKPFSSEELYRHLHVHFGSASEFRGQVYKDMA